jgi:hypothetical protein
MGNDIKLFMIINIFFYLFKNYNKNRIHSARGAKDVEISLDGHMIFKGEISQACGNINATNDPSAYGEVCIVFFLFKLFINKLFN